MKDQILELIRRMSSTSFVEITALFPNETGEVAICSPEYPNIVLWEGMSPALASAISELISAKEVVMTPCHFLVYLCDGAMPKMPLAKRKHHYKTPHWLPVTFKVTR